MLKPLIRCVSALQDKLVGCVTQCCFSPSMSLREGYLPLRACLSRLHASAAPPKEPTHCCRAHFTPHKTTMPSCAPEASVAPSGEKTTLHTQLPVSIRCTNSKVRALYR